jgi:hypothetical protein
MKDRFVAAGIHLGISLLIAGLAALLVFGVLYPYPFREISGGSKLFAILVGVDVTVGPILTGLVFNRRKPASELRRDLTVIGVLQLIALVYGMWSMYQARPVYLVHEVDRFVALSAADIDPADLPRALPGFQKVPSWGIRAIGLREPKDPEEKLRGMELAIAGKDLSLQPWLWQELSSSNRQSIHDRSKPLNDLASRSDVNRQLVNTWLDERQATANGFRFFPLVAREHYWTVVLDENLNMVGYLPIDPF